MHKDDENSERVLHRERLENSGCEVEYARITMDISVLHGIDINLAVASVDTTEAVGIGRIGRHFGNSVERGAAVVVAGFIGSIIDTLLVRAVGVTINGRRLSRGAGSALVRSTGRVVKLP
jgi:hypothetical protein